MVACTAIILPPQTFRSGVTSVHDTCAASVTGVTSFKPITRLECATDAMPFTVEAATKWINVTTVPK